MSAMNQNLRALVEGSDAKTHWPEQVKKGKTYMISGFTTPGKGGMSNSEPATFIGWDLGPNGPVMRWENADGTKWNAIMYEGEMRAEYRNGRFTIGYED